jgi:glycosyltransferase involved in cell wall biosynthesis
LRFIVKGSRQVMTVTNDLRAKLIQACPDSAARIEVLSMGTRLPAKDREVRSTRPESARSKPESDIPDIDGGAGFTALFVGRLEPIKGAELLLRAANKVRGIRVLVAGDGAEKRSLEGLASRLRVNAVFLGSITAERRERLFGDCQVLVVPSIKLENNRTEGLPVVCLEAMAAGLPVVGSRTGGIPELIRDEYNGLLFPPGDEGTLSVKLRSLMDNPERRRVMGANARATAAAYDWRLISKRFTNILSGTLEGKATFDRDK